MANTYDVVIDSVRDWYTVKGLRLDANNAASPREQKLLKSWHEVLKRKTLLSVELREQVESLERRMIITSVRNWYEKVGKKPACGSKSSIEERVLAKAWQALLKESKGVSLSKGSKGSFSDIVRGLVKELEEEMTAASRNRTTAVRAGPSSRVHVLRSGKHRREAVDSISENDPGYCDWALRMSQRGYVPKHRNGISCADLRHLVRHLEASGYATGGGHKQTNVVTDFNHRDKEFGDPFRLLPGLNLLRAIAGHGAASGHGDASRHDVLVSVVPPRESVLGPDLHRRKWARLQISEHARMTRAIEYRSGPLYAGGSNKMVIMLGPEGVTGSDRTIAGSDLLLRGMPC